MRKLLFLLLLPFTAFATNVHQAQYGVAGTFNFVLYNADGTLDVDEVDGGTEVSVSCNEGAETTATNDFVDEGTFYSIALTAAEMECARVAVVVAATDTNVFFVETWGDTEAQIRNGIASGTAQSATSTTLVMDASESFADDELNNSLLCITGGTGKGQCAIVTDTTGSTDTLSVASWTTTPSGTITYIVFPANQATLAELGTYLTDTTDLPTRTEMLNDHDTLAQDSDVTTITGAIADLVDGTTPVHTLGFTIQSGTADSGTTTTLVDAALTESDADYWASGVQVTFTGGNISGQAACVKSFSPATDTITFEPAITQAVSTNSYVLVANAACDNLEQVVEDQGVGYSASDVLSILFSEAIGTCTYTSGTRTWVCQDPGGNETRFTLVYGTELDGDRTTSTPAPATP